MIGGMLNINGVLLAGKAWMFTISTWLGFAAGFCPACKTTQRNKYICHFMSMLTIAAIQHSSFCTFMIKQAKQ
jgi:hypothetical protein